MNAIEFHVKNNRVLVRKETAVDRREWDVLVELPAENAVGPHSSRLKPRTVVWPRGHGQSDQGVACADGMAAPPHPVHPTE